ncbi:Metallo-dependent phosphatase-like protein [Dichotomocladium elegans]|nr:Metallo-dependent phosphatase-like protein [Dichotomocladium elegans]
MDDTPSNLFYFVQISDLHVSKFESQGHTTHFLHFMRSVLPMLRPECVIVTGDLTDAKDAHKIKTEQYKEEWEMYKAIVEQSAGNVSWYDMKGNHDAFNLASWESAHNLYRDYGKSAKLIHDGHGVYAWDIVKPYGRYRFVAADATPKRGPGRPLNFFGYFTSAVMDRLTSTILQSTLYNHTFVFSHYPTTTMVFGKSSTGKTFQDLASRASVYFCGHLHRLFGGLGDVLQRYNYQTDMLELELADMKDHGAYRIVAIDHDLISFTDIDLPVDQIQKTGQIPVLGPDKRVPWPPAKLEIAPVVVITNPKDSRYVLAHKEPFHLPKRSSHVRFLVFSDTEPSELRVRIFFDDKRHPFPATFVGNASLPLWVSTWDPNDFDDREPHTIRIEAVVGDRMGQATTIFRMDAMRDSIRGGFGEWFMALYVLDPRFIYSPFAVAGATGL